MKAITVKQPWATLIAEGYKEYEFRTWKTSYRGDIFIHAGKGIDKEAMKYFEYLHLDYPLGCIIAKAQMIDCVPVGEELTKELLMKNENVYHNLKKKKEKRYAFQLSHVEKIKPIPIKGNLSLWEYNQKNSSQ